MSFAKRQQNLKDKAVRGRIEGFLKEEGMAEQLRVTADGELIVLVAEGEDGKCEIKMHQEEAERFYGAIGWWLMRITEAKEARLAREARKIEGVDDGGEE